MKKRYLYMYQLNRHIPNEKLPCLPISKYCFSNDALFVLQTSALFAYSKNPHAFNTALSWNNEKAETFKGVRRAAQVDMVPTISLLLGCSIPFSNLGRIIPVSIIQRSPSYQNSRFDNGGNKSSCACI